MKKGPTTCHDVFLHAIVKRMFSVFLIVHKPCQGTGQSSVFTVLRNGDGHATANAGWGHWLALHVAASQASPAEGN